MVTEYEWILEHIEDGEVVFTDYFTSYRNAMSACTRALSERIEARVALLRDHPQLGREWAYSTPEGLAPNFTDAEGHITRPVPQRYRLEHARG